MIIYNVFPLLAGPLTGWTSHFERAAAMEFDWIFVNPIQRVGKSESLYSVADYYDVHPLLVDPQSPLQPDEQVRRMTADARDAGLNVMTDLVLNHCAIDSTLVREHAPWFAHDDHGNIEKPFCFENGNKVVWEDLARFDHKTTRDPEGLYRYSLAVVEHLIDLGFSGFRCDAAYQIPVGFWKRLIGEIRAKHPGTVFAAETLGCLVDETKETATAGFDFVFNSAKWWDYTENWLLSQYNLIREVAPSIGFPESHDTPRLCEELHGNLNGLKQRYLFTALFSAGVMMPIGFEFGFRKRLHVISTRPADWEKTDVDLQPFIKSVNAIKKRFKVFQEESPTTVLPCNNPNVLLMWKASSKTTDEALLLLNKDIGCHQEVYVESFRNLRQAGAPLADVSPEYPLEYIAEPFRYALRPGQGIVLVTSRT